LIFCLDRQDREFERYCTRKIRINDTGLTRLFSKFPFHLRKESVRIRNRGGELLCISCTELVGLRLLSGEPIRTPTYKNGCSIVSEVSSCKQLSQSLQVHMIFSSFVLSFGKQRNFSKTVVSRSRRAPQHRGSLLYLQSGACGNRNLINVYCVPGRCPWPSQQRTRSNAP